MIFLQYEQIRSPSDFKAHKHQKVALRFTFVASEIRLAQFPSSSADMKLRIRSFGNFDKQAAASAKSIKASCQR